MRKFSALLLLLLIIITPLCAQNAMAQTGREALAAKNATLVPRDRITFSLPSSMKYSIKTDEGKADYVIEIDKANTDWDALVGELYSWGQVALPMPPYGAIVTPPEGTVSQNSAIVMVGSTYNGGNDPEPGAAVPSFDEALVLDVATAFTRLMPTFPGMTRTHALGALDPNTGYFTPRLSHWLGYRYDLALYCWVDGDGNETYEYLIYSYQMDTSAFAVNFPKLTEDDLIPAANLTDAQKALISFNAQDNSVSYQIDATDTLSGVSEIKTGVRAPSGAQSDWTCSVEGPGIETYMPAQLEEGIPLPIPTADGSASSVTAVLKWYDADGVFKTARLLTLSVAVGEPRPWPALANGWTPVPQSRMRIEVTNPYPGMEFSYTEKKKGGNYGVLATTIDATNLPSDQPLDDTHHMTYLIPPEGAVSFRIFEYLDHAYNPLTALRVFDNIFDSSYSQQGDAERVISRMPLLQVADHLEPNGILIYGGNFMSARALTLPNGRSLVLYTADGVDNTKPYRGGYRLINWYDADGNILCDASGAPLNEYYVVSMSTDVISYSAAASTTLDELRKQNAKYPRLLIEQGAEDGETYSFWFSVIPKSNAGDQANSNAKEICYELYLTDAQGNVLSSSEVRGLGEMTVYLPYPEGVSFNTVEDYLISVSHLGGDEGEHSILETFEGDTLQYTEDGIIFTATSFSPYALSWEPAHNLTTTGSGDTLTQRCTCGDQATATVSAKETYAAGEKVEATVTFAGEWQGDKPTVTYCTADGDALAKAPTEPGKYAAVIESDGARAEVFFTIVAASLGFLPQTGDPSLPLLLLAATAICALGAICLLRRKRA